MALSDIIDDFKRTLKSYPLDYNLSEIINYLEGFCEEADRLQNELDTANDKIYDLEQEIKFLEDEIRGLNSEL